MTLLGEQSSAEQDFLDGPGFTGKDVEPSTWQGLSALTLPKAIVGGVDEGVGVLAHGLPSLFDQVLKSGAYMGAGEQGTDPDEGVQGVKDFEKPWMPKVEEVADTISQTARVQAKSLMPDPAVSGTGTNLIYGFTKAATEAVATVAVTRNPMAAAPLFGYLQGMGHYQDLRDQGVDDATAQKSATLQGLLAAGSFAVPGGLPTKWLDELGPATQAITQLTAGAAINTASGMVSRYGTSKILEDAGYHEQAEQNRVLDGQAMVADILSGAFFGGVHYFHGRAQALADRAREMAENGTLDPAVRDAAKVAQDARAAAVDRAPGVPVDADSAGAHQAALEKAVSDLLSDKPIDVSQELDDSDKFAARPEDPDVTLGTREMIHREFIDAGVLSEASQVDSLEGHLERLYRGESVPPFEGEVRVPTDVLGRTDQADTTEVLDPVSERLIDDAHRYQSRDDFIRDHTVTHGNPFDRYGVATDENSHRSTDSVFHGSMDAKRILNSGKIEARVSPGDIHGEKAVSLTEFKDAASNLGAAFEIDRKHVGGLRDVSRKIMGDQARSGAEVRTDTDIPLTKVKRLWIALGNKEGLHTEMDTEHSKVSDMIALAKEKGVPVTVARSGEDLNKIWERAHPGVPAQEAMRRLKESQDADEGPQMIDLAAKCAGMTR